MAIKNWVSTPAEQPLEGLFAADQPANEPVAQLGVGTPQKGVPAGRYQLRFAPVPVTANGEAPGVAPLHVVSAHGGAGGSTLASLLSQRFMGQAVGVPREMGQFWPHNSESSLPVVLACRTHLRGLQAAQQVAAQWASGGVPGVQLLGLVATADAPGKLPRELRDLLHVLGGGLPATWQLPWVEGWRTQSPILAESPRAVQRIVDELAVLMNITQ